MFIPSDVEWTEHARRWGKKNCRNTTIRPKKALLKKSNASQLRKNTVVDKAAVF
jgi:hypothetical protein